MRPGMAVELWMAWCDLMNVIDSGQTKLYNDTDEETVFNVDRLCLSVSVSPDTDAADQIGASLQT